MDWKLFSVTFGTIFLAELGDKTQVAAIAASAEAKSLWEIWLAVVLALGLAGTLGVLFGRLLSEYLNPSLIRYLSGGLFVIVGFWILFKK
jgi:putative Ca2+/H+ antiporter (TMEM165/GDT1 family)